jgi:hypothetical protein
MTLWDATRIALRVLIRSPSAVQSSTSILHTSPLPTFHLYQDTGTGLAKAQRSPKAEDGELARTLVGPYSNL